MLIFVFIVNEVEKTETHMYLGIGIPIRRNKLNIIWIALSDLYLYLYYRPRLSKYVLHIYEPFCFICLSYSDCPNVFVLYLTLYTQCSIVDPGQYLNSASSTVDRTRFQ